MFIKLLVLAFFLSCSVPKANEDSKKEPVNSSTDKQPQTTESKGIGTFNLKIFGKTKVEDKEALSEIKKIASNYYLLSVQEIRDISGESCKVLTEELSAIGLTCLCSQPDGRTTSKESYGLCYDEQKFDHISDGLFNDVNDDFERTPWYVELTNKESGVKFLAYSLHIKPDDVKKELTALSLVVTDQLKQLDIKNAILLGDLNADCSYLNDKEYSSLPLSQEPYRWVSNRDLDTTTGSTDCGYDHIIEIGDLFNALGSVKVLDVNEETSDHKALIAYFESNTTPILPITETNSAETATVTPTPITPEPTVEKTDAPTTVESNNPPETKTEEDVTPPPQTTTTNSSACCKYCDPAKSKPCGDSCISLSKSCTKVSGCACVKM